jgi:hypothetical protein
VLSFGGFMGMGNKLFAMPCKAFQFHANENKLILNVDKEKLKTAPLPRPKAIVERTEGSVMTVKKVPTRFPFNRSARKN